MDIPNETDIIHLFNDIRLGSCKENTCADEINKLKQMIDGYNKFQHNRND